MASESSASEKDKIVDNNTPAEPIEKGSVGKAANREIKGNIPYSSSPGSITLVLEAIIAAERPDKFTNNFMETVLN